MQTPPPLPIRGLSRVARLFVGRKEVFPVSIVPVTLDIRCGLQGEITDLEAVVWRVLSFLAKDNGKLFAALWRVSAERPVFDEFHRGTQQPAQGGIMNTATSVHHSILTPINSSSHGVSTLGHGELFDARTDRNVAHSQSPQER